MIRSRIKDGIATLELSDCRLLTRCDLQEGRALADALQTAGDDDGVRAIVLLAQGGDFCPPARVRSASPMSHSDRGDLPGIEQAYSGATGVYQSLAYCRKVTIMGIQGVCAGAGSALALCADLVVMGRSATIRSPFADVPESSFTLATLIMRLNRAKGWVMSDGALSAADAEAAGFANRIVPDAQVRREALAMARTAACMPLDGMAISRVMQETFLDSQGVGKEFDHMRFYRGEAALLAPATGSRFRAGRRK